MSESRGELKVRSPATAQKTKFDCEGWNCSLEHQAGNQDCLGLHNQLARYLV